MRGLRDPPGVGQGLAVPLLEGAQERGPPFWKRLVEGPGTVRFLDHQRMILAHFTFLFKFRRGHIYINLFLFWIIWAVID